MLLRKKKCRCTQEDAKRTNTTRKRTPEQHHRRRSTAIFSTYPARTQQLLVGSREPVPTNLYNCYRRLMLLPSSALPSNLRAERPQCPQYITEKLSSSSIFYLGRKPLANVLILCYDITATRVSELSGRGVLDLLMGFDDRSERRLSGVEED